MEHSVKLRIGNKFGLSNPKFYYAHDKDGFQILDLCAKHIHRLWPETKESKEIIIKVSEKRHKRSRRIRARIKGEMFSWSAMRSKEEDIDYDAGEWILKHFPYFKNEEQHLIHVSAKSL